MKSVLAPALLFLACAGAASAVEAEAIPSAYIEVASSQDVPPTVLYRFALGRSGVLLDSGQRRPWPWTLSIGAKTKRYKSRGAALKDFRHHLAKGEKDLNVGLLQLPWARYEPVFSSAEAAFDPLASLKLAARLLNACRSVTADWNQALVRCGVPAGGKPPYTPNWDGVRRYAAAIRQAAQRHRLDPALVAAVVAAESNFKPKAKSSKEAQGLMQLIPATAARFGVRDPWDPVQNLQGGTKYLRWLLDTFDGDLALALAGYNAGEKAVIKYGHQIPPYPETRKYVPKVFAFYELFRNQGLG